MISLPGYIIRDKIYESRYSVVYRGERESDRRSVIIKLLNCEYPTIQQISKLRQEYLIPNQLNIDGVVKACSLEKYYNTFALILEDILYRVNSTNFNAIFPIPL